MITSIFVNDNIVKKCTQQFISFRGLFGEIGLPTPYTLQAIKRIVSLI